MTYVMWRRDKGFRVGTTRTSPDGGSHGRQRVQLRAMQEHADAAWVVSTHETEAEARVERDSCSRCDTASRRCRSSRGRRPRRTASSPTSPSSTASSQRRHRRARAAAAARPRPRLRPSASRPADLRGPPPQRDGHALRRPRGPDADAHRRRRRPRSRGAGGARGARAQRAAGEGGSSSWRYESLLQGLRRRAATSSANRGGPPDRRPPMARLGRGRRRPGRNTCRSSPAASCAPGW